jgi:hypothetical protein
VFEAVGTRILVKDETIIGGTKCTSRNKKSLNKETNLSEGTHICEGRNKISLKEHINIHMGTKFVTHVTKSVTQVHGNKF